MADELQITPEQLTLFRRCQFARRVFVSYPSLRSIKPMGDEDDDETWHLSKPYTGEPFNPEEYELLEGDWDHEHCDVCWAKIVDGISYWSNVGAGIGQVDLCEACYTRVTKFLNSMPTG